MQVRGKKYIKQKTPKPLQSHKSKKHKKKTPNSTGIIFLGLHPNIDYSCFRDAIILRQGNEGVGLQQTVLKSVVELKHNCPLMQHL